MRFPRKNKTQWAFRSFNRNHQYCVPYSKRSSGFFFNEWLANNDFALENLSLFLNYFQALANPLQWQWKNPLTFPDLFPHSATFLPRSTHVRPCPHGATSTFTLIFFFFIFIYVGVPTFQGNRNPFFFFFVPRLIWLFGVLQGGLSHSKPKPSSTKTFK